MAEANGQTADFRLAVSPTHLVFSEVLFVTSAMRKNSRWASSQPGPATGTNLATSMGLRAPSSGPEVAGRATKDKQEANLMAAFDQLKRTVQDSVDILSIPLPDLLAPFLALIRSPLSTGPITAAALASVHNFYVSGLVSPNSPDITKALIELSSAVAHCKFEASDSSGDEVVLLRIVNVIDECQASSVGHLLGDVELCEMLETVLTICCQMRLSESIRRYAEGAMNRMVYRVFSRLDSLDPSIDSPDGSEVQASTPYGLPTAQELLRVLVNLLDPNDQQHTDSIRLAILGILNVGLESRGTRIAQFPSLSNMLVDQGCKYLFQLARSENVNILRLALRVITTLFDTMRDKLKLQFELFLSFTMDRLAPPVTPLPPRVQLSLNAGANKKLASAPGTPRLDGGFNGTSDTPLDPLIPDDVSRGDQTPPTPARPGVVPAKGLTRELLLETLGYIARQPTFMVDLWVNYDSDVSCEDLFERLVGFLTRGVYPTQYVTMEYQKYASQLLCLDLLLAYVDHMASRVDADLRPWPQSDPKGTKALEDQKATKGLLIVGAAKFNMKPKVGLAFLEENGLIYKPENADIPRAKVLAMFLKNTPRLDKKVLGEWISAPDNEEVLKEYLGLFDFHDKSVADAMRLMLESFRLPGEAGPIGRITENFADIYFATKPPEIKTTDAVYVLAYSVIMLNTDLYNPQNRKRMTLDEYTKNLRGVNGGDNFDPAYIKSIYDSIKKREIVMPEEHSGQLGFEYAWKALLLRTKDAGPLITCNTDSFDRAMFQLTWKSVISAIAFAFTAFDDDYVVERAIAGFRKAATLAGHFQLPEVFDYVVKSLSHATGLLAEGDPKSTTFPVIEKDGQSLTVSPLSIKFGLNLRGQLAAVVLFTIANGNGNAIREGWLLIFEMFQTLFIHSLLPPRMLQMEDFLGGISVIPMQGTVATSAVAEHRHDGLLSALSSYLLTPYGSSSDNLAAEPTPDDVENTLCTLDCITSCKLDELYSQIMTLEVDALVVALRALQTLADRRTVDILVEEIITDPMVGNGIRGELVKEPLPYDPSSVFLLETMVSIVVQTRAHIEETWPMVFEHISGLLKNADRFSILLIERAVVGLLKLCLILAEKPTLRDQIYLSVDLLRDLPILTTNAVAEQVAAGLALLVKERRNIMSSSTEWGLVLSLIRGTIIHSEAAKTSFQLVQDLLSPTDGTTVTTDNFNAFVNLLEGFATAAGLAVEGKRQEARRPSGAVVNLEPAIDRGMKAVDMISDLKKYIPSFIEQSSLPVDEAWRTYWMALLGCLGRQSTNACRDVRHLALDYLQRILLASQISANLPNDFDFAIIFEKVLFPLHEDLLKPQIYIRDAQGMSETRLRAAMLLCKAFLQFNVRSAETVTSTAKIWSTTLDILDRFMNSGKRDQLYEAVPESLKNLVLVLNASQVLLPPQHPETRTPAQIEFWSNTESRLEEFLPGFLEELIPTVPPPAEEPEAAPAVPVV